LPEDRTINQGTAILRNAPTNRVEVFQYPASNKALPVLWQDVPEVGGASPLAKMPDCRDESATLDSASSEPPNASATEGAMRNFEAGRKQGIRETREMAAKEHGARLQEADRKRVEQAAYLAEQVADERDRLVQTMEREVASLALAIASRILRHEAQMDPLFLLGSVRVALGQLAATMQVRLRVPAPEAGLWTETLAHIPNLKVKPTVIPDDSMRLGECVIETDMGSADLGLRAQLRQIELALLDGTPATKPDIHADPSGEQEARQ
jgi:flagellar biosynthesis/type III secretory pathway protein FliH